MKYSITHIMLFLTTALSVSAQDRFLLHVTPNGRQEAIRMKDGETIHHAAARQESARLQRSAIIDTLQSYFDASDLTYEFGNLEEEMMFQWYQPAGNGFVRELLFVTGSDIGETQSVTVRAWYPSPRLTNLPEEPRQKNMGYYPKNDDPVNQVTPYRDQATDTTWVFPPKSRDSAQFAFDPLGVEALWKKGGITLSVQPYTWNRIDLLATGDTMQFAQDQLIGFTILNPATGTAAVRQEIISAPNPDPPFHSLKFYPRGRLSTIDRGWWIRGDFDWGMYVVVEYTSRPRPKIVTRKLLNTASTASRSITANIVMHSITDPVTVTLFSRSGKGSVISSAMTRLSGTIFTGTVPAAAAGDSVHYYLTAKDSLDRTSRSSTFAYLVLRKSHPLLLLYNGKELPTGIIDPTIYLKFTMKTDFGAEPYYDFCDAGAYTAGDFHLLMDQYNAILEVTGSGGAKDLTRYSGEWLSNSASLPAGTKRYYLLSDQDHGRIGNVTDTVFANDDVHAQFFGLHSLTNKDFPLVQNVMKPVTFPWQLSTTAAIASDPLFTFIPGALTQDTVTLWYHPYYEVPLFTNRMDEAQPSSRGSVIFADKKTGRPVGLRADDPNGKWTSWFLAFDWMALDVRSDTSTALYTYPFLDPKYRWISDIKNIGKAMTALAGPTAVEEAGTSPAGFALYQNFPNPFNPSTTFRFRIPSDRQVTLDVYDVLGARVAQVLNGRLTAGEHSIRWNAGTLPSGIYFYRLTAGGAPITLKLLLLK